MSHTFSYKSRINDLTHFDHKVPRKWKLMKCFSLCYGQIFCSFSINYFESFSERQVYTVIEPEQNFRSSFSVFMLNVKLNVPKKSLTPHVKINLHFRLFHFLFILMPFTLLMQRDSEMAWKLRFITNVKSLAEYCWCKWGWLCSSIITACIIIPSAIKGALWITLYFMLFGIIQKLLLKASDAVLLCYISHFHRLSTYVVCLKPVQAAICLVRLAVEPEND